jgi:hypothetical protein
MPRRELTGAVLASPEPELYRVQLNNFTSDILGTLADRLIELLEPQLDYQGMNPLWWPADITFTRPGRMLKHGRVSAILSTFKVNIAKIKSRFSNSCFVES